jgi:outer membrane biosynthesis protein TonB
VDNRYRKRIIILSVLLHLLFFLIWEGGAILDLFKSELPEEALPLEAKPIVFDLREPQRPREVIQTPEDAQTVEEQKQANFLSDKNALARNQEAPTPGLRIGEGFARGDLKSNELPENQGPIGAVPKIPQPDKSKQEEQKPQPEEEKPEIEPDDMSVENLTRQWDARQKNLPQNSQLQPPGVQDRLPSVLHDNQNSQSLENGGLSFNTYDWDFAPYMLMLKKKIGRNIFPPVAFTHLGLIDGETLLRFRIYPDGRMTELRVLDYNGHKSLMETSYNAVDVSAPFPPLPGNFPEPYLEVTGKFIYYVKR